MDNENNSRMQLQEDENDDDDDEFYQEMDDVSTEIQSTCHD